MIPLWVAAALLGLGFGFGALAGALWRWRSPSLRRLERVVTFSLMGAVFVTLGTVHLCTPMVGNLDPELADTLLLGSVLACFPFCVVGFPVVHWWAGRRYRRPAGGTADYQEDAKGNAVRGPSPDGGQP